MGFTCPLLSWCKISNPFREKINDVVFHFLSTSSCSWPTYGSSPFKDSFPSWGQEVSLTYTRPPRRPLHYFRGWIFILGFIRSPPRLVVYDVAHSLPLGLVNRDFLFTEDENWRHSSCIPAIWEPWIIFDSLQNSIN